MHIGKQVFFDDEIRIRVGIKQYTGISLEINYEFFNASRNEICTSPLFQTLFSKRWETDRSQKRAGIESHYYRLSVKLMTLGKSRIVVIKSRLGQPIAAFSGDDVYWEVPEDLPQMTKLMVDGKALYIHRANYQIIDKELL